MAWVTFPHVCCPSAGPNHVCLGLGSPPVPSCTLQSLFTGNKRALRIYRPPQPHQLTAGVTNTLHPSRTQCFYSRAHIIHSTGKIIVCFSFEHVLSLHLLSPALPLSFGWPPHISTSPRVFICTCGHQIFRPTAPEYAGRLSSMLHPFQKR